MQAGAGRRVGEGVEHVGQRGPGRPHRRRRGTAGASRRRARGRAARRRRRARGASGRRSRRRRRPARAAPGREPRDRRRIARRRPGRPASRRQPARGCCSGERGEQRLGGGRLEDEHGHPPGGQRRPAGRRLAANLRGRVRLVTDRRQPQRQLVVDGLHRQVRKRLRQHGERVGQFGRRHRERMRTRRPRRAADADRSMRGQRANPRPIAAARRTPRFRAQRACRRPAG